MKPASIVLVGEIHGTRETPAAFGELVCHAAGRGPVIVALELPVDEQDALDAFIAAADEADARKQLLAARHWRWEAQDGRGSQAMFDLLARVRELRAAGATIAVRAFDLVDPKDELREQKMAANIQLMREEDPHATLLALTGNLHGSTVKGTP